MNEKVKQKFTDGIAFGKAGRMGTYTAVMAVILVAVLVFVNLIFSAIPSRYTKLDTSVNNIYTLSSQSTKYLSALKEDVTLNFVCSGGTEDEMLSTFLDRFTSVSSKISVKKVDPVSDPTLLEKYPELETADNFSVIAVSGKRSKLVGYSDMYYYFNEQVGELSSSEFSYYNQMYGGQLEAYYGPFTLYFSGDAKITGAIEYVTAETVPTVYILEGHGEAALSSTLVSALFDNFGIAHSVINIAIDAEIPADADTVIVNNPSNDITAGEAMALIDFIDRGGNVLLFTSDGCDTMTNLMKVTGAMGLGAESGIVSEGDSSKHYPRNARYIYPEFNPDHAASKPVSSYSGKLISPSSHGIVITEKSGVTATWLARTSDKATTTENDEAKSYILSAAAEKGSGKLIWTSSADMISDTFINATSGYNLAFVDGSLSWMQNSYSSGLGVIDAVSLSSSSLAITEGQANFWGGIMIFVIPIGCIAIGTVIVIVRKRR
ncbi:MAG: GldG family protein [Clostridia bacterium]|nr:GldG family protein [Clostridia bacterium]